MTGVRRAGIVLRGLLAVGALAALVIGVPVLLVGTVGNPIPPDWTWDAPLTSSAVLGVVACVACVFWAQLVICVAMEVIAEIRAHAGRSADWLPGCPARSERSN